MRYDVRNTRVGTARSSRSSTSLKPVLATGPAGRDGSNVLPTDEAVEEAVALANIPGQVDTAIAGADIPGVVETQIADNPDVVAAAASLALSGTGLVSSAQATAVTRNRLKDPQVKTTGGSTSNTLMPFTRITTGLPTINGKTIANGVETTRASTLSAVIANLSNGYNNNAVQTTAAASVTPGEIISAAAYGWTDQSSARSRLDLYWHQSDGTFISISSGTYSNIAASTWEKRTRSNVTVPANAAYVAPVLVIATQSGNTVTGAKARGTAFMVVSGNDTTLTYGDGTFDDWSWDGTAHLSTSRQWKLAGATLSTLNGIPARVTALEGAGSGLTLLSATKAGNNVTFTSKRQGAEVTNQGILNGSNNGAYSIRGDLYAGASFRPGTDEVTPIRTQNSTIAGGHGFAVVAAFTNPDSKDNTDLGATYQDSAANEYRILGFDTGKPILGRKPGYQQRLELRGATAVTLSVTNSGGTQTTASINVDPSGAESTIQSAINNAIRALSNVGVGLVTTDYSKTRKRAIISFDPKVGSTTVAITAHTTSGSAPTIHVPVQYGPAVLPASNLTHVSGGTHSGTIDYTTQASAQLFNILKNIQVVLYVDGAQVTTDGTYVCRHSEVRETFDTMDYASMYNIMGANVGQTHTALSTSIAAATRHSNVFRYRPGALCEIETELLELLPTNLGQCGFIQSSPIATPTRYLPGYGLADGVNWTTGVDMSTYSTDNILNASERAAAPVPAFALDVNSTAAWAMGYIPFGRRGDEVTRSSARLAQNPDPCLWDMRGTDKDYPIAIDELGAGWGQVSANSFRTILHLSEATTVLASKDNALSAFAALDAIVGLTH